jgi:hypothetical protein
MTTTGTTESFVLITCTFLMEATTSWIPDVEGMASLLPDDRQELHCSKTKSRDSYSCFHESETDLSLRNKT